MRRVVVLTALPVCFFLLTVFNTAQTASPDAALGNARRGVSFVARSDFPTAQSPVSMTIGDFNNDGLFDIATVSNPGSSIPNALTILLGKGNGTFKTLPDLPVGTNLGSTAIVTADFNGDSALDLAVANRADNSVTILTGLGDGTFQPTTVVAVGPSPVALVFADFNNDGIPDLAVLNQPTGDLLNPPPGLISILLGQGDGTFQVLPAITIGTGAASLVAGDFNNDGLADLAVSNGTGVSILIGQGSGAFQAPAVVASGFVQFLAVGDFNGDGNADLADITSAGARTSSISILLGQGDGTFQPVPRVLVNVDLPTSLAIGDVDGDGIPDLTVTDLGNDTVSIATGRGDGTFNALSSIGVGSGPRALTMGDFKGNGRLDLATANRDGSNVSILLSRGRGRFEVAPAYPTGACCPPSLVVGDFDGDGVVDLAEANFPDSTISILKGLGNGRFQTTARTAVPNFPSEMAGADFDGDGHLDLAIANQAIGLVGGNTVSILLGRGDLTFQTAPPVSVGSPVAIVAADLNNDGRPDLAVTNVFGNSVSILLGNGDGTFQHAPPVPVGNNPTALAAADLNGDGCIDLVVANLNANNMSIPGSISVLLGQCDGTFQIAPEVTVGVRPLSVAVGDLNGDGQLDLAVVNEFGNPPTSILLGNGDGTFQAAPDVPATGDRVLIADFNGDGYQDLAVSNVNGDDVTILLGRGDGTFRVRLLAGVGQAPEFLVQADFNGDGFPDLATADYDSQTVTILMNRTGTHRLLNTSDIRGPSISNGVIGGAMRLHALLARWSR
ncbi:MAG TPA: VCBS repeat-containing protein [Vicinamibacterales bacterium]|jgi:hypothetical protein|nr:VCBS repeat-containing protein [Vicinamibacterales bacterium]